MFSLENQQIEIPGEVENGAAKFSNSLFCRFVNRLDPRICFLAVKMLSQKALQNAFMKGLQYWTWPFTLPPPLNIQMRISQDMKCKCISILTASEASFAGRTGASEQRRRCPWHTWKTIAFLQEHNKTLAKSCIISRFPGVFNTENKNIFLKIVFKISHFAMLRTQRHEMWF